MDKTEEQATGKGPGSAADASVKKAYETPALVEHGTVEQLTQGVSAGSGAVG